MSLMRHFLGLALLLLAPVARAYDLAVPIELYPHFLIWIEGHGREYGLKQVPGGVSLTRADPKHARTVVTRIDGRGLYRLVTLIDKLPDDAVEPWLANALHAYLEGRAARDLFFEATLFKKGSHDRLTPLGKSVIIDILTAEDGLMFEETDEFKKKKEKLAKEKPAPWPDVPGLKDKKIGVPLPVIEAYMAPSMADVVSKHIHALGFDALWAKGMTGAGVVIGVLDSGLDMTHPDLRKKVIAYDNITEETPQDIDGHGTHVSGVAVGDGAAFPGGAPRADLAVFKVLHKDSNTFTAPDRFSVTALQHIASMPNGVRPRVVNISLAGQGDPQSDELAQMAAELTLQHNILVVAAAGNDGPEKETVEAPGNSAYVLTVGGVDANGNLASFSAAGPVKSSGRTYNKPDLTAVSGVGTHGSKCWGSPNGVEAPMSSSDTDKDCADAAHPRYRWMTGTSQATPMAAAAAADVIGYLLFNDADYQAVEVKAVMMETAEDLKAPAERQGAGRLDGKRLAAAVERRVALGVPVGNLAYMLAVRLTSGQRRALARQKRWRWTPVGILDSRTGRLLHSDREVADLAAYLEASAKK
jgi:subtilisin family serine protease